jgi:glutaredoxin
MTASRSVLLILCAALGFAELAAAQTTLYRWVDKDGKVQFSDVPPNEDVKVQERAVRAGGPESSALPYATQVAMRRSPVTLFAGKDCTDACEKARNLLKGRGIPYSERDAQADKTAADLLTEKVGELFIPALTVGDTGLKGYQESAWHAALDTAGYPRTLLPGQIAPKAPEAVKKGPETPPAQAKATEPPPETVELVTERR